MFDAALRPSIKCDYIHVYLAQKETGLLLLLLLIRLSAQKCKNTIMDVNIVTCGNVIEN